MTAKPKVTAVRPGRTKIKICGIADRQSLSDVIRLGADAVGFVFYDASPRAVVGAQVHAWVEEVHPFIHTVGVFVDEKPAQVLKISDLCRLEYVQLHGQEPPEYCADLPRHQVIKAFRVKNGFNINTVKPYVPHIAAILMDSPASGEVFNWGIAREIREAFPDMPMILSGGLSSDNIDEAIREIHPFMVDISSKLEVAPGVKDPVKVTEFLKRVAAADIQ